MQARLSISLLVAMISLSSAPLALAHESQMVANERFRVSVGLLKEPILTQERNGLDLIVRPAGQPDPIPGLEDNLNAEIIAPDGDRRLELPIRPQYGSPGRYTFDVMLTEPGIYKVRVWGEIEGSAFDETFTLSEARPLSDIRFP